MTRERTILQKERDRLVEATLALLDGSPLAVSSRNVRTVGNKPFAIATDYCDEFASHDWITWDDEPCAESSPPSP